MNYLKDVVTLSFDQTRCTGCAVCTLVCPHQIFKLRDGKAFITERDRCIECGACANNCTAKAISVKAGVGCAAAMINGLIRSGDPSKGTCGCSEKGCC